MCRRRHSSGNAKDSGIQQLIDAADAERCCRAVLLPCHSSAQGMFVNFDGQPLAMGSHRPDEIITCEVRPDLVREARLQWGVENNIYQFGHRG